MTKISTRWTPKLLAPIQPANRADCCQEFLQESEVNPDNYFHRIRMSGESNNLEQQLLRGNKKTNREGSRNNDIDETRMEWQQINYPQRTHNPDNMCLHRTPLRLRNLDPEGN